MSEKVIIKCDFCGFSQSSDIDGGYVDYVKFAWFKGRFEGSDLRRILHVCEKCCDRLGFLENRYVRQ